MARSSSVNNNSADSNFYIRATSDDSRIISESFKRIEDVMFCMRALGIYPLPSVLHGKMVMEAMEAYHEYCLERIREYRDEM